MMLSDRMMPSGSTSKHNEDNGRFAARCSAQLRPRRTPSQYAERIRLGFTRQRSVFRRPGQRTQSDAVFVDS
jgi:hypothetical protein